MHTLPILRILQLTALLVLAVQNPANSEDTRPTFQPAAISVANSTGATSVLRVYNGQNFPVSWSIKLFVWSQGENPKLGDDILESTSEISVKPDYVSIPPNSEKLVNITYESKITSDIERAYRMILTSGAIKEHGGEVTFTQSLPIFVSTAIASINTAESLEFLNDGRLAVTIKNDGYQHVFVKEMGITGSDPNGIATFSIEQPGWYLLPGKEVRYFATLSLADCKQSAQFKAVVLFRDGSLKESSISRPIPCSPNTGARTSFEGVKTPDSIASPIP